MLFLLANDKRRLSSDHRLRAHFSPIRYLPHDDEPGFLEAMSAFSGPLVLFWHEPVGPALSLLSALRQKNLWPDNLKGVVLYRWAKYAGVGERTRADARQALEKHGLGDGSVHLFAPPVGDDLEEGVPELILSFIEAARAGGPERLPFERLDPPEPVGIRIAILLAERLIRRQPAREAEIASRLDWTVLCAELQEQGLALGEMPVRRPLRTVAAQLRATGPTFLQCSGCAERGGFWHGALGQERTGMEGAEAARHVAAAATDVRRLLEQSDGFFRGSEEVLLDALRKLGLSELQDELLPIAAEIFEQGCPLTMVSRQRGCWKDVEAAERLEDIDPHLAAERLRTWLVCNVRSRGVEA